MNSFDFLVDDQFYPFQLLKYHQKPLQSLHNPKEEAKRIFKQQNCLYSPSPSSPILIIATGLGSGFLIEPLMQCYPHAKWIIIEETPQIKSYLSFLLEHNKIAFRFYQQSEISSLLQTELDHYQPKNILLFFHPQVMRYFPVYQRATLDIQEQIHKRNLNYISDFHFGYRWSKNTIANFCHQAIQSLQSLSLLPAPVWIVGSGYSSFLWMYLLQKIQHHLWIIAVPSALKLLKHWNIQADIVLIADSSYKNYLYCEPQALANKAIILSSLSADPLFLKAQKHPIYFFNTHLPLDHKLLPHAIKLPSNGSIGNLALNFTLQLNCRPLLYSGFDFGSLLHYEHFPLTALQEDQFFTTPQSFFSNYTQFQLKKPLIKNQQGFNSQANLLAYESEWIKTLKTKKSIQHFAPNPYSFLPNAFSLTKISADQFILDYPKLKKNIHIHSTIYNSQTKSLLIQSLIQSLQQTDTTLWRILLTNKQKFQENQAKILNYLIQQLQ